MKTNYLMCLFVGSLLCLSACGVQADVLAAPQPVPEAGNVERAEEAQKLQEELTEAQQKMQIELKGAQHGLRNAQMQLRNAGVSIALPSVRGGGFYEMGSQRENSVLLIPQKPLNAKTAGQLSEDMQVMLMILKNAAEPELMMENPARGGGGRWNPASFFGARSLPTSKAIWLESYGMIFTLAVDFPLVSMNGGEEKPPETAQEKKDEVWNRSKNRLKGLDEPDHNKDEDTVVFDPDKAEKLQKKLTESLKHASNIRNLAAKDRVVVVVRSVINGDPPFLHAGHDFGEIDEKTAVPVPTSVMTIQAEKQDIDAFADGKIDLKAFTKKVTAVTY
ncbi:MAG: hypothetical protein ACYSUT_11950 [Planctomycetota bacterium]